MAAVETPRVDAASVRGWMLNVGTSYGDILVGGAIYLFLTPVLIRHLGMEAYAVWVISHVITFYLGFLDLGFDHAQVRFHARYAARGRIDRIHPLLATTTVALSLAGVAGMLLAVAIAFMPLGGWFEFSGPLAADLGVIVAILGANLLLSLPGSVLENVYEGAQRFDLGNLRSMALRMITAAAQLVLVLQGYGVVALAAVELCVSGLRLAIDLVLTRRLIPGLLGVQVGVDAKTWRRIRPFAIWAFLDDVMVEGSAHLDKLLLALFLPLAALTPYALCTAVAGLLLLAVQPITETFFPMAAALHGAGKKTELVRLLLTGTTAVTALAEPVAIFLAFFGGAVLHIWVPEAQGLLPAAVVPTVVVSFFFSVYFWTGTAVLMALGRIRLIALLTLLELGTALALMAPLVPAYGLTGFALAALAANVVVGFALLLPAACRACGLRFGDFLGRTLGRLLLAGLPAVVAAAALRWPAGDHGWLFLAAAAALIAAVHLPPFLLVGMDGEDRARYLEMLRGMLTGLKRKSRSSEGGEAAP